MKNLKLRQNSKSFSSNCGRLVAGILLAILIGLGGCGAHKPAKTPTDENLIKARETVRQYWSAIISKDYQSATQCTDASKAEQVEAMAALERAYKPLGLTKIIAVDKAYYNPKNKRQILVPYRIKGMQELADKAIVRVDDPKQGWRISGGI
jgi:hypothetical protein